MTPQTATKPHTLTIPRTKRRVVRRPVAIVRVARVTVVASPAFVPIHREMEFVSPNGTRFRASVPLNANGEPMTNQDVVAYLRNRPAPDPEVWDAVMKNINDAREADRNAPDEEDTDESDNK